MSRSERTILVVCADRALGREYLRELQHIDGTCPARLVTSEAEARRSVGKSEVAVVVLDESSESTSPRLRSRPS